MVAAGIKCVHSTAICTAHSQCLGYYGQRIGVPRNLHMSHVMITYFAAPTSPLAARALGPCLLLRFNLRAFLTACILQMPRAVAHDHAEVIVKQ